MGGAFRHISTTFTFTHQDYRYPPEILNLEYVPNFAIRGLHYDIRKGWALKLDTFLNIQKVCKLTLC